MPYFPPDARGSWSASLTASQVLTASVASAIAIDRADYASSPGVIDLAGDRFVLPATGRYELHVLWRWEGTAPSGTAIAIAATVGGVAAGSVVPLDGNTPRTNGGLTAVLPISGNAGDAVQVTAHPGSAVGVTVRGDASVVNSSQITLVRLA